MYKNLLKCECGGKPVHKIRVMAGSNKYHYYQCSNSKCPNFTFSTRDIEAAEELWTSGIINRQRIKNKK
jgi:hypothetical protein